jgi:hypothetical protein
MNKAHDNICNISFPLLFSLFLGLKQLWKCNRFNKERREKKGNEKMAHMRKEDKVRYEGIIFCKISFIVIL